MPVYLELLIIIVTATVLYHLFKIPTKRFLLVSNLKRICKKQGYEIKVNHTFRSMFKRENEPDIIIKTGDGGFRVFILTTRYHRVRYHFPNQEYFEVMGKGVLFAPMAKARPSNTPTSTASFHYEFYKTEYDNFDLTDDGSGLKTVLLVHPIPLEVSAVKKMETVHLWDGDELYKGIIFYSGGGFKKHLNNIPPKYGK